MESLSLKRQKHRVLTERWNSDFCLILDDRIKGVKLQIGSDGAWTSYLGQQQQQQTTTQQLPKRVLQHLRKFSKNIKAVKNGPALASFSFIFVFSNKHYSSYNKKCEKMTIQYTVLGLELITLGIQVSSHND